MRPCYSFLLLLTGWFGATADATSGEQRPNILLAISDDVSWPHASAYGSKMVRTPVFDELAKRGVLFSRAFCASPGCSPSRAALLTGRHIWEIEHAGTHASYFSPKYDVYPERLEQAGYFVGYTGKGWGPGDWKKLGRTRNPAGQAFNAKPSKNQSRYVAAFEKFLKDRPSDKPFCFWFGGHDAHRPFQRESGVQAGKRLADAEVPKFLPDTQEVRSDLLDYAVEIERFDDDLGGMLKLIEQAGELDNTLVIVTSDNGMAFPRAKANCYEYGIHMPLAISWPRQVPGARTLDDLVGFVDLTATIYEAASVEPPQLSGTSLLDLLRKDQSGRLDVNRKAVYAARERHSSSRFNSLGYPQRCIRTDQFLLVLNLCPERWPAGAPRKFAQVTFDPQGNPNGKLGPPHRGYHDIDGCPTLDFLVANQQDSKWNPFLQLAVAHRPRVELFDIQADPECLRNLAAVPEFRQVAQRLEGQLLSYLQQTGDARVTGDGDVWENYPRVSALRWFPTPDWATQKPERIPEQAWVEQKRPR